MAAGLKGTEDQSHDQAAQVQAAWTCPQGEEQAMPEIDVLREQAVL